MIERMIEVAREISGSGDEDSRIEAYRKKLYAQSPEKMFLLVKLVSQLKRCLVDRQDTEHGRPPSIELSIFVSRILELDDMLEEGDELAEMLVLCFIGDGLGLAEVDGVYMVFLPNRNV